MDATLAFSRLDPLLHLQHAQLMSFELAHDGGRLLLVRGQLWLTAGAVDVILQGPADYCLPSGRRIVLEGLGEGCELRLLAPAPPRHVSLSAHTRADAARALLAA